MNEDISRDVLVVMEHLGIEARSYSGRGMNGASCIGVDCGSRGSHAVVARIVIGLMSLKSADEESAEHFTTDGAVATDSMGRGSIVYFPRLPWVDVSGPETEDEPDSDREPDSLNNA